MSSVEFNTDQVLVFKDTLHRLKEAELKLRILEEYGIEYWQPYNYAMEDFKKERYKVKEQTIIDRCFSKSVSLAIIIGDQLFVEVLLKNTLAKVKDVSIAPYNICKYLLRKASDIDKDIEELVNDLYKSDEFSQLFSEERYF
jgi:hypothetical protein